MAYFTRRTITPERMDEPDVPETKLRASFRFIRAVNRWLGGSAAVVGHLKSWSRKWRPDERIRILDVATGSADIPLAILRWAKRARHDVRIVGVDRHGGALRIARDHIAADPLAKRIELVACDALKLPFPPKSFDYCITSMFLHHLSDIELLTVLRHMERIAKRGIIWNDLHRSRLGYWTTRLVTLPLNDIVRFDGPVSVLAGFKRKEVLDIRERLSLDYTRYRRRLWHRFTLAGEKN